MKAGSALICFDAAIDGQADFCGEVHSLLPERAGATVDLMRQYLLFLSAGVSIISFGKVSHLFEVSSHTMVFTMLQCSNTRWTRLLELGFISKICLDEWNSLSLIIENLYPCSFNCLSSAAIITLKLSGSKSSQFLSFTFA